MSQHDYNIANQGFPNFRSDLNNALGAIATNNSGSTAPTTTFAHQWWLDTSTTPNTLRIRNADNDAWVVVGTVNQTDDTFVFTPAAGSASAPAYSVTGDTNTGIFFPAADTIAFAEGGAEAMRIDSSGRFLVGTTTARTVYTGYTPAIQIEGTTASTASMSIIRNSNDAQEATLFFAKSRGTTNGSSTVVQSGDLLGQVVFNGADGSDTNSIAGIIGCNVDGTPGNNDMPGRLTFATTADGSDAPTERMRIDSSGNVGIGTTSPNGRLDVTSTSAGANTNTLFLTNASSNASTATSLVFGVSTTPTTRNATIQAINAGGNAINLAFLTSNADVPAERMRIDSSGNVDLIQSANLTWRFAPASTIRGSISVDSSDVMYFRNGSSNTERARITSGGQFLVGATSASTPGGSTSYIVSQGDFSSVGGVGFGMSVASTTGTGEDHYYISFQTATTTQRGYIYYNNGAGQVQLSATSDARLKENIVDAPSALPVLEQVKVRQYDWKETGNTNIGFVAQELHEVIPRAVAVGQDNEDGTIKMAWGVDNASLVPYLVKAIQEQQAMIDELKVEVAALKAK